MIPSVNALLGSVFAGVGAPVRFDPPLPSWSQSLPKGGLLSAYLHQVRDETNAQNVGWEDVHADDGRVLGRRPPDRYFRFAYLVTAWAPEIDAEHTLLGAAMKAVVEYEALGGNPAGFGAAQAAPIAGSDQQPFALTRGNSWVTVGSTHLSTGIAAHDILSSLGVAGRSSLDVVVVAPLRLDVQAEAGPPTESLTLGMTNTQTMGGSALIAKDPLANRQFTALRLREQSNEARPVKRRI
jgi:Pvc16 N-terminal domain